MKICLEKINFGYAGQPILQEYSLELNFDEDMVICLAGVSGRGKTTLLRLMAGLEQPDSGKIIAPKPEEIALLFQENRLFSSLTVREQVDAVLPKGAEAMPYLESVELSSVAEKPSEELSGGMQRRLSLARALAVGENRRLLLLDEPFAGVDIKLAERIMTKIRALGKPVLYTAHGAELIALADRVVQLI